MRHESLNPTGIPAELKQTHRWVLWALCDVTEHGKLRKSCKVPFDAKSGSPASHSDFETWTTFEVALAAHTSNLKLNPPSNVVTMHDTRGIGMVLGPPFFGKDFDKCIVDGVMDPEVEAELAELNTFAEISQSGSGVHVIGHGEPPYLEGHRKDDREIYSCNRFFVMTGNVIGDYKEVRRFTPVEVAAMYAKVKAGRGSTSESARVTTSSAKIAELMVKTDSADVSRDVQSLLTLLAIEHICDPVKVEEEFKKSKLYTDTHWSSEKWDRLGKSELEKAMQYARENIAKRRESGAEYTRELISINDANGREKKLRMAWDPVLPIGKLSHFAGPSSQGKSPVTMDLVARVSRGATFPNGAENGFGGPRKTILFNIEDGFEDTILPRYRHAGGATGMLEYIKGVRVSQGTTFHNALVAFDKDIRNVCDFARRMDDLGLVVIDPITNYLGKLKMNAEEDVRSILTPLAELAEELDIVVITVGHLNKSEGKDPLQRMMGATAFIGVARSVYLFSRNTVDLDKADDPYAHVMAPARGQMGESFRYHTEKVDHEFGDGEKSKIVIVKWDGVSQQTAEEGTSPTPSKREVAEYKEAGEALAQFLQGGARHSQQCREHLKTEGWDLDKLNSKKVREAGGVRTKPDGRRTLWYLPTNADLFETTTERTKRTEELKKDDAPEY